MRSLRARVSIDVAPIDVFRVLTDFSSYKAWNPWLRDVHGEARVGERVQVKPNLVTIFGYRITYELEKVQTPDTLRWRERAWFEKLFYTVREYQVFTRSGGVALYTVTLRFAGPIAPLVGVLYGGSVQRGLRREAEALKKYCEERYPKPAKEVRLHEINTRTPS